MPDPKADLEKAAADIQLTRSGREVLDRASAIASAAARLRSIRWTC